MNFEIPPINPDSEIVTIRTLHFPIALVYKAWENPNHLKNWWGPHGFTNTFTEFNFKPQGKWSFIMHGPEKGNYPNECEFIRIEKPSLIHWKRHSQPLFDVLVTFEELDINHTKIVFRMIFGSKEACDKIKKFVIDKNEENFDRLEAELQTML